MSGSRNRLHRPGPLLVGIYILFMPLLAGLPRGSMAPLVRPSEILQIGITAVGLVLVGGALAAGHRSYLHLRPTEWWLGAVVIASSIAPLLWLAARGLPIELKDVTASLPFIKYAALYFLARVAVRSESDAALVIRFIVGGALIIASVAFAQAAGITQVNDVLDRWFVTNASDLIDNGRARTTIGSSIATGSYLAMSCGLALSFALGMKRISWLVIAMVLGTGALATGQVGAVVVLVGVVLLVARFHGRLGLVVGLAVPVGAAALAILWPIVTTRLADIDPATGLPGSWVVRWTNVTELYWPSLVDGGWILGVGPDATIVPPDVWREQVFLESGYLWLLWVGGLPLLTAAVGFLAAAWRDLGYSSVTGGSPVHAGRLAARASIVMIAFMTVLDPHLTLRAEADLFFIMLAVGAAAIPFVIGYEAPHQRWHDLIGLGLQPSGAVPSPAHPRARLQISEANTDDDGGLDSGLANLIEYRLALTVRADGHQLGRATLVLYRYNSRLHGIVGDSVRAVDRDASALVWRAIALCADSLRLDSR
ncbi:MAG: hypothetical protein ACR2QK_18630 [Acidimicrobiales bacterium]